MIRVILFLAVVALLALGAAWFADRPGDVVITWLGYRIETSLMVVLVAIAVLIAVALMLWSLLRTVLRMPDLIRMALSQRRGVRSYQAISRGLTAVGAGDVTAARKFAEAAARTAPGEPLTLLLAAQSAQLAGDRVAAEATFRAMAERDDTRLLGLHGLYVEARRRSDIEAARGFAEQAALAAPALRWAGQAVLDFRCAAGEWDSALAALTRNHKHGLIGRDEYRRQRAVLLTAHALDLEDTDRGRSRALALEAVKLAPSLVPAVELAARFLGETGEIRKASRMIETAWRANPHPDLADAYAHLRPGDSARERLVRVQALAQKVPDNPESALAVARAALDAQDFAAARAALQPLLKEPTRRVAELMAEIEQRENGDEGRAREWMTRALRAPGDPAWAADGYVSDRWMPVSPVSGRLDAFQWKVPIAELVDEREVIEAAAPQSAPAMPAPVSLPNAPEPRDGATASAAAPSTAASDRAPLPRRAAPPRPRAEAVIPIARVPDDPGPEPEPEPPLEPRRRGLFG